MKASLKISWVGESQGDPVKSQLALQQIFREFFLE